MREFRPFTDELRPLAVESWATDPDDAGEGFTVEFLLTLPAPVSDDIDEVLRTCAAPLLERLGFDAGSLDVDVEDRNAVAWADDDTWPDCVTDCGASVVSLRIGRDPNEPYELVPEGGPLTDDEVMELRATMDSLLGLVLVLNTDVVGLETAQAREVVRERAEHLRLRLVGPRAPESGIRLVEAPPGEGTLQFSVAVVLGDEDPEQPAAVAAAMTAAQEALGSRGWEPVSTLASRSGPCLTSGWQPSGPPLAGIARMRLFAAKGWAMSELAEQHRPCAGADD
ncbi:hypothetical protein IPZ58_08875 [Streptomyces roseoverticillatus]|uniref:hypothetical protein n=1 Tax=Streptomyces roseoverticillatus TaxID=66429 RepID=UPI001F2C2592|nr:hypothetical protein [Streptomyces roseoverticillatus]MCF3101694.1 hypothetical protein [Streptomyces roseoverticillatus]